MRILISCGEASGELHAAALARELRALLPKAHLVGIGGDALAAEGVELWARREELAVMGFVEVIRHLPRLHRLRGRILERARREGLDLFLPVDYPGFHISLAGRLRAQGVRVLDFIPPKTWSWGGWRVRSLRRAVDLCAVIFPFEEAHYRAHGIDARWVGHPFADRLATLEERERSGLLLAPGSREQELRRVVPVLRQAVLELRRERAELAIYVSRAPGVQDAWLAPLLDAELGVELREEPLWELLRGARAAVVTSGTATLESALAGTPHLIVYRTSALSYAVARTLASVEHIGMANIVLGRRAFPEFLQGKLQSRHLLPALCDLLDDETAREAQREACVELRASLGPPGALQRVAGLAAGLLDR